MLADADAGKRVTIRGRGTSVVIEGDRTRFLSHLTGGRRVLAEAVRLKRNGEDDAAVAAYLRGHQADLPSVIDAADVARLRGAGAGKTVMGYLVSVAAVDIGLTGEGSAVAANAPIEPAELEAPPYAMPYGYPVYSSPPFGFRHHHLRPHGAFPIRPIPQRPVSPSLTFPHAPAMRGSVSRFPIQ